MHDGPDMSTNPTHEEIMEAIRQSGYLMEQHVATQLEALNFYIKTNVAFEDPDEGKSREMDVSAIKRVATNESAKVGAIVELIARYRCLEATHRKFDGYVEIQRQYSIINESAWGGGSQ